MTVLLNIAIMALCNGTKFSLLCLKLSHVDSKTVKCHAFFNFLHAFGHFLCFMAHFLAQNFKIYTLYSARQSTFRKSAAHQQGPTLSHSCSLPNLPLKPLKHFASKNLTRWNSALQSTSLHYMQKHLP